ncbi:3D domain-containing protein [Lysinibacillus louembei]|uniref:3D domain-containing protein n=1 Tax=Lysinibacillus louembei TaxID=1470088 RepID=A0ABZ0RSH6_9BACI|nr:3D domain-containing protein [Lysinibacillus louembei]WPK10364.1 3D domain-containing protein [Lysinibacillus louembei]
MKTKLVIMSLVMSFLLHITAIYPMAAIPLPLSGDLPIDYSIHMWDALSMEDSQETGPTIYTVEEGDNLYRIALTHGVPLQSLMAWNDISNTLIFPGDELTIYSDGDEPIRAEEEKVVAVVSPSNKTKEETVEVYEQQQGDEMVVTATAYTAYCEGCSGTTAYGIDLRANPNQKVIAVDPRVIPLGTKVWVEGYGEAIAGDTGGAIKGHKIDVFIPEYENAMQWGVKTVKIKVLN